MAIEINNATSLPIDSVQNPSATEVVAKEVVSIPVDDTTVETSAAQAQVDREVLEASVSNINDFVQNIQRSIHFSIAESSGRTVIEVYDSETDELIRSIPSEEVQRLSEAIADELSEGLLIQTNI